MFDVGFWEMLVIGVIALLVIGPERLPRVARTLGLWFGKARYFLGSVKEDIDRELKADELKQMMQEQAKSSGIHEIVEETGSTLKSTRSDVEGLSSEVQQKARQSASEVGTAGEDSVPNEESERETPRSGADDGKHTP